MQAIPFLVRRGPFLGALPDGGAVPGGRRARAALFGAPLDLTVSFRAGSRGGPARIREVSEVLEEYSMALGEDLADHPFRDLGDVDLVPGNAAASLERIGRVAAAVLEEGMIPLALGGEHLVTWPLVEAVRRCHPDVAVLQFDAHADLRADYLGERLSHATVLRLVAEALPPGAVYQFGIRSATAEELAYARRRTRLFPDRVLEPLREVLGELGNRPLYVTVDIDVCDPAFAPGTGTPEPGGITAGELLEAIRALRGRRVVGFDLVEVSPPQDPSDRTAILAAKVLREAICCFV